MKLEGLVQASAALVASALLLIDSLLCCLTPTHCRVAWIIIGGLALKFGEPVRLREWQGGRYKHCLSIRCLAAQTVSSICISQ